LADITDHTGSLASAEPRANRLPSWVITALKGVVPWVVVIAIWEAAAAAGWRGAVLFPPPSVFIHYAVESDFRVGFGNEAMTIPFAIVASALRVLIGLAIGFVAAIATGILISTSKTVSEMTLPIVRGLAPIAPIAWIPLGIVLFGIGNPTAIFVVFMGVYFILTISTVAAVGAVDPRLIKTARSYGATKTQVWTRVMIILGREMFNTKLILLGMCMVGITGYLVDVLLVQIQRKLLWWQSTP
jgi:NitT/TauT family transport system permease protein